MSGEGKKEKRGCFHRLATLVALVGLAGLAAALYFIAQPQDLSDIDGAGRPDSGRPVRDLLPSCSSVSITYLSLLVGSSPFPPLYTFFFSFQLHFLYQTPPFTFSFLLNSSIITCH